MKKIAFLFFTAIFLCSCTELQQVAGSLPSSGNNNLSQSQIVAGLKQALTIGTQNSANQLSAVDGFFADAAIKILMPPEAQNVEKTLRQFGLGSLVDKAVLSLNRAAEDAAKSATPIFTNAIKQMTITDALGILRGGDFAATNYFKGKTTAQLTAAFSPVIEKSLNKVDATKYWSDVFTAYNKFAAKKVPTDISAYVTQKAIDGIFYEVGLEEQKIRKDPAARVTELLKTVFGSKQATTK
ncbi:DUF4197 domain-containing protein [Parafilimonas terrae]|uniref:DUF4197 domain-containing protein n=1 Tax=Parafilimonas terrae TaxID=1465490 RepID=A0A1I5S845_9BACT|nr:DUF4197 domain-containing protein [Parafilimonas terrae]SFP66978.1 Protein of unknown function [Parafilimonas terrae]